MPAPSPAGSPVPPKHDQPGPASPASSLFALRDLARRGRGRGSRGGRSSADPGSMRAEVTNPSLRLLRVEEEAVVVVRHALRRGRRVRRRHPQVEERLARPHLGSSLSCGLARRAVDLRRRHAPRRGSSRAGWALRILVSCPTYAGERLPGRPRRHEPRLYRGGDDCGARGDLVRGHERERRDAAGPVAAGALLGDDGSDVSREARRRGRGCRRPLAIASAASGTASDASAAATTAIRTPLRMLGVICTPKLAEGATDLADRAADAKRISHGRKEVRVGFCRAADLGECRGGFGAVALGRARAPCARAGVARSRDRRAAARRPPPRPRRTR